MAMKKKIKRAIRVLPKDAPRVHRVPREAPPPPPPDEDVEIDAPISVMLVMSRRRASELIFAFQKLSPLKDETLVLKLERDDTVTLDQRTVEELVDTLEGML
jgi:hypothetical protein